MSRPHWNIEKHTATLTVGPLTAQVALRSPAHGVHNIVLGDTIALGNTSLDGAELLCITGQDGTQPAAIQLEDAYARGHDLVADYALRPLGLKLRVYWTASCDPASPDIVALALTASLRTDLLVVVPAISCHSTVSATAVQRLDESLAAHPLALATAPVDVSTSGTVASLFYCPDSVVYAELPHPTDVPRSSIIRAGETGNAATITHELFTEPLEKGVIVRARILGLVLPQDDDTVAQIAERYRSFAAMDPPLDA